MRWAAVTLSLVVVPAIRAVRLGDDAAVDADAQPPPMIGGIVAATRNYGRNNNGQSKAKEIFDEMRSAYETVLSVLPSTLPQEPATFEKCIGRDSFAYFDRWDEEYTEAYRKAKADQENLMSDSPKVAKVMPQFSLDPRMSEGNYGSDIGFYVPPPLVPARTTSWKHQEEIAEVFSKVGPFAYNECCGEQATFALVDEEGCNGKYLCAPRWRLKVKCLGAAEGKPCLLRSLMDRLFRSSGCKDGLKCRKSPQGKSGKEGVCQSS
eukprot:TRINITY_DN4159_c1_g2_i2.p1 TRINITY_DN4159_c1_g2~~TRINITY_DN4159_c1_g2_i2.p1  ORF type:complete len:264 (+),score=49.62 TRINITY_DN4159_c1_g2_i2:82-873(+)